VQIQAPPDFIVLSVSGPSAAAPGDTVSVTVSARNLGPNPTQAGDYVMLRVMLSPDQDINQDDTPYMNYQVPLADWANGATVTRTFSYPIPPGVSGVFYWGAYVDVGASPPYWNESNEGNNARAGNTVQIQALPDFVVESVSGPPAATSGGTVSVTVSSRNLGPNPTQTGDYVMLRVMLSPDQDINQDDTPYMNYQVPLADWVNGATVTRTFSYPIPPGVSGTFYWGAYVDVGASPPYWTESNEDNNARAGNSVQIQAVPDFVVESVSGPPAATSGDTVSVTVSARNLGPNPTQAGDYVMLRVMLSPDQDINQADTPYMNYQVPLAEWANGATVTRTFSYPIPPGVSGTFYWGAYVDVGASPPYWNESNEDNNARAGNTVQIQAPPTTSVSNVRAAQRAGSKLVDLFYDLSGAGPSYSVSVAVSSDGGATFTVPATHVTGDGVTSTAAPGAARHIVWDASADFPGQFSTMMRVKVAVGSAFAVSPIFAVDTRTAQTGTLTGLVQGSGAPVANAQVRIDGTGLTSTTGADGRFTLANVPVASGYLLKVSAAGFASKQKPGITVTGGTTDLGTIQLTPLAGPYRLVPLQPDVNPLVTQIENDGVDEDRGVGYRYYRFIPVNANDNLGEIRVSLRVAGGRTISQAGDVSDSWPGRTAGVSDNDGIVRLRIPASALGGPGASETLEVVESGIVKATFPAQVVARQFKHVWKHEWEGELGLKLGLGDEFKAATHRTHETTVMRGFNGVEANREIVGRTRDDEFKVGVSLGNSVHVGRTGGGATEGLGGALAASLGTSFYFSPDTKDRTDNLMKFYVAFADDLNLASMGNRVVGMIQQEFERYFLANQLESTTAALRGTGHVEADAGFGAAVPWSDDLAVYSWADLSADVGLEVGVEDHPGQYLDCYAELAGNLREKIDTRTPGGTAVHIFMQPGGAVRATVRSDPSGQTPRQLILESKLSLTSNIEQSVPGWPDNDLIQLRPLETAEYQYRYVVPVSGWHDIPSAAQSAWSAVRDRGQGLMFTEGRPLAWVNGISAAVSTVGYENRVYSADVVQANSLNIDLPVIQFQLQGQAERGAELMKESGVLWQDRRFVLGKYSDVPRQYYPSENIFDLERRWVGYALAPLNSYLNRAEALVASVGDTVVQVGSDAAHAVLQFGQGVMAGTSKIVTKWVPGLASPSGGRFARAYEPRGHQPKDGEMATNLVYGIGGIYRFESTNSFNGTGTLTIPYSPAEATGLNPADLRIYYLPDGTNRWQLVGGTVNVASNTVTAIISKLGTY
jgi:hypothetical protein